ncbi:Ni/Fe-hydrogenase cytochrome b subunit [[Pasteurella] aerogenes]|nr:Ni/Fe-hydrogenase cytochrome b subunit [[Pasteurella] aerogenes]MCI7717670.1 Ni/Fe-hydrogenase cytochrome b subunit [[Pasteurella] aerogenes]MCU9998673.1 Ni/Fe-hydrogenase cytochrome b subunit [[Pasteurella] aerogenes]MDY2797538.1 Ni/Fe-hydrogenase cytochrome b subunit [[Pasteurella] aerogenes]MDY4478728.1 Ni/Fe-hydrogenase cytochrome b subunit [[Pasteurella] aerogenes]
MSKARPLGGKLISIPVLVFAPIALICLLLIVKRMFFGIGSVTELNGGYPWGIWIAFDLLVGTGFACGGWALAWAVYVFNKGKYHPLVRPALLASLFGYTLGGLSITIDMGRYWNMPNFFIPGQFNTSSVLFETAVCMTIYIGVVTLEFAPVLLGFFGLKKWFDKLNKVMFFIIALGALLPMMHQSSMGSLMIAAGHKVHPVWQSYEMLPLFSLLTAFIMGFSIVVFEGSLVKAGLAGKAPDERHLFIQLIKVTSVLMLVFVVLRFGELIYHDKLHYVLIPSKAAYLFWTEIILLSLPIVTSFLGAGRKKADSRWLFISALSMLIGAALWRMDYSLIMYDPGNGYQYFPSAEELLISIGFVSIEVCAYILIIRLFPVLPVIKEGKEELQHHIQNGVRV